MTPKFFYHEIVTKNLSAFAEHRDDFRLGFNAYIAAFHMGDHIKKATGTRFRSLGDLRRHVNSGCSEHKIVQDVANAFKHFTLERSAGAVRHLQQVKLEGHLLLEAGERLTAENDRSILLEDGQLMVTLSDGTQAQAFDTVDKLVKFWRSDFPAELT